MKLIKYHITWRSSWRRERSSEPRSRSSRTRRAQVSPASNRGIVPVVRWFADRPKRDATRLCVYWHDVHLFVFHWGLTVRWRRPENFWRHATLYMRARPKENGRGGMLSAGTWLTEDGAVTRVPQSKKYVALKVLG